MLFLSWKHPWRKKITDEFRPKKHGAKWTADDNRYLLELWYDQESIVNIAETLERSEFSIICQLPWKAKVKLSSIISEITDQDLLNKAKTLYFSDYPDLVDIEVDEEIIIKARKERSLERAKRNKKIDNLLKELEIKHLTTEKSGLEELVIKIFKTVSIRNLSLLEIKERLVWICALALMFPDTEYDVLFTVYPDSGAPRKKYKVVAEELEIPKHQIEKLARNAVNRLIMMVSMLGDNIENYVSWISINKFTYANMTLENPKLTFPEIELKYDKIPQKLQTIDNYDLSNSDIKTLNNANIFCLGNLLEYEYEDLRFELKLEPSVAQKVFSIKESYSRGGKNAWRI